MYKHNLTKLYELFEQHDSIEEEIIHLLAGFNKAERELIHTYFDEGIEMAWDKITAYRLSLQNAHTQTYSIT